jgi:hypothetical protein
LPRQLIHPSESVYRCRFRGSTCTAVTDGLPPPTRTQFDCLHAGYLPALHGKSQQGSDDVPSIVAAGAGIHVNESERLVAHDFQDVGVAGDEQTRPQPTDFLPGPTVVVAGIPADVRHVDVEALTLPGEISRQIGAEFRPVNVPVNSPDRPEGSETIRHFGCPEVSRVPHLVAFGKVMEHSVIQKAMGVGKQADPQSPS